MIKKIDLRYIWLLLLKNKKSLIIGQLVTFIAILISIPIPLMLPVLVDEVLLDKPDIFISSIDTLFGIGSAFYYIAIITISVILLRFIYFIFSVIITKIFTNISKFITYNIRKDILEYLKNVSMNEYESLGSGAIGANLVTDVNTLDNFILTATSKAVASILTLVAIAIVLVFIHPILGLLILVVQPFIMYISKKISKNVGRLKGDENRSIEVFQENISEVLELYPQIKSSNKESEFFDKSILKAQDIQVASNMYSYKSVAYERFSYTLFLMMFELLRASGLVLVVYSDLSIGMMFAMFGYIWFIMTPVQDLLSLQYSYASALAAMDRINKIFKLKKEYNSHIVLDTKSKLDIDLVDINFSYSSNNMILKNIDMSIKYGDKIALIGASGSGKSTLAQMIVGFYNKSSGRLKYNGIDIEDLEKHSIRESLFLVMQMPMLFNATLRFNISMGDDSISDKQIYKALEIAQLKNVVGAMNKGLDTIVGRHGVRLSGGQRQRLSIARMIIANPKVVIFDESTSALDVHIESKLFESLKPILKSKTVITIAHRLSTVQNSDTIFVLDDGKIVQKGTHEELEYVSGHYQEFVKQQLL